MFSGACSPPPLHTSPHTSSLTVLASILPSPLSKSTPTRSTRVILSTCKSDHGTCLHRAVQWLPKWTERAQCTADCKKGSTPCQHPAECHILQTSLGLNPSVSGTLHRCQQRPHPRADTSYSPSFAPSFSKV